VTKISCDVIIEIFLNEQARCQKWKTNMYMYMFL